MNSQQLACTNQPPSSHEHRWREDAGSTGMTGSEKYEHKLTQPRLLTAEELIKRPVPIGGTGARFASLAHMAPWPCGIRHQLHPCRHTNKHQTYLHFPGLTQEPTSGSSDSNTSFAKLSFWPVEKHSQRKSFGLGEHSLELRPIDVLSVALDCSSYYTLSS
jgi:hypothetical protein